MRENLKEVTEKANTVNWSLCCICDLYWTLQRFYDLFPDDIMRRHHTRQRADFQELLVKLENIASSSQLTPLLWLVLSFHLKLNLITQILIMNLNLHQSQRICHKMENYICFQMHRPANQIQNQWMCRCTKKNICVWIQGNHQRKKHKLAISEIVLLKRKLNLQIFHRSSKRSLKRTTITMMTILWKTMGFKKNFDMHSQINLYI